MKVDVETVGSYQKKLTVLVPPKEVRERLDRAYKTLSRQVRMPGFRAGKAPRKVLEARYGERVEADVAEELIQKSWSDILAKGELEPVGRPSVAESGEVAAADGFRFIISVDVRPDIDLQTYTGLEVTAPTFEIQDDSVEAALKAKLEGHARLEEVTDRPCQDGDMALTELRILDGEEEVTHAPGTMIRVEGDPYYPGVEDHLVGLSIDESTEAEVTFPDDAREEVIAGRTLTVQARLIGLQSYVVPEASDELAEELGYEGGVEGMRAAIRKDLEKRLGESARNQARANVLEAIIAANEFDVPEGMVESSLNLLMEELRNQKAYQLGRDPRTIGFSDAQVADLRRRSQFAAKASLILEWVAEKESITVEEPDLDARYQQLADDRGQTVEAVKGWFAKESAVDELRERLLEEKTLDWLLEHANVTYESPAAESEPETVPEGDGEGEGATADGESAATEE